MLETLQHITNELTPYLHQYGYLILAFTIAVEGIGIPAPGQSFLIVSGLLAANGDMSLTGILVVGGVSAFIGNTLGYFIGWRFGDLLLKKGWVKAQTKAKMHAFIERYGIIALLMSRFIEGLKQTMCIGCGIAKLPLRHFLLGNALASSIWVLIFGLIPALLKQQMLFIFNFYHTHRMLMWSLGSLVIICVVLLAIKHWQKHKQGQEVK